MDIEKNKNTKVSNKTSKDLHKMEKKLKKINFDYLQVGSLNVEIENQSLDIYLKYLKGV